MTDPKTVLAVHHAAASARPAISSLFSLDERLAGIVRNTREPLIGQMRLTWWHDALTRLDTAPAPAEPVLQGLHAHVLPLGVTGSELAAMTDGWEDLIVADPLDAAAMERYASVRGGGLFAAAGRLLGGDSPLLVPAGRAWALADLAGNLTDRAQGAIAADLADAAFIRAFSAPWPRPLRAIGMLSLMSRLERTPVSPMTKALRVSRFRLIGR